VRYYRTAHQQATEEWVGDEVTIATGDAVSVVEVSFMGVPTGSAVEGTIEP
jgi:hypothetical protein